MLHCFSLKVCVFLCLFVHSGVQAGLSSGARLLLSTWRMQVSQQNQESFIIFFRSETQSWQLAKTTSGRAERTENGAMQSPGHTEQIWWLMNGRKNRKRNESRMIFFFYVSLMKWNEYTVYCQGQVNFGSRLVVI